MGEWTVSSGNSDDDDNQPKKKTVKKVVPRRSVLKKVGLTVGGLSGVVVAGIGAQTYQTGALNAFDEGPGFEPLKAWQAQLRGKSGSPKTAPDGLAGSPKGLIAAGLLAASPHNSQPWKFVVRDRVIEVMADERRTLGAIDPHLREMTIGLGCCIENMVIGASAVGINPLLNVLPDGPDSKVIARLTIYDSATKPTKEAEALAMRHTNRGPYELNRQVESKTISVLEGLITSTKTKLIWLKADSDAGRRFSGGTLKATADFIADQEMVAASDAWLRMSAGDHRDGLTLPTVGVPPWMARVALALPKGLMGNPHQEWFEMTREVHLATAPLFGLIAVPALNDRAALIEAGRLWQRMHIQATVLGLAVQPLNQLMEMTDRDAALQRTSPAAETLESLATLAGDAFAFAFRIGYSRFMTNPSPRRNLADVIAN